MNSSLAYVFIASLVLLQAFGCSNPGARNDEEARDVQQLTAHEYDLSQSDVGIIDILKDANTPLDQLITDDINLVRRSGSVSYDQVMASPRHTYDFSHISLSGYVVDIHSRNYGAAQGVEAYVAVDGPEGENQVSEKRYALVFSPNNSSVHKGGRCVIFGSVWPHDFKINTHPVLVVYTTAILTPDEAARYGSADDSDITLGSSEVPPSMIETDYPICQMIQDSGGSSLDALVANAKQALQTGVSGEELLESTEHYKAPICLTAFLYGTRKVDSDFGTMYLSEALLYSQNRYQGFFWVFCATKTNARKFEKITVIGYAGDTRSTSAFTAKVFIVARAILDDEAAAPVLAKLPPADQSAASK
ncbi:MAG TPA: hypothetical protein VI756_09130 [Blastocatellia bacterium]